MITWNGREGLTEASEMGFAPGEWPDMVTNLQDDMGRLQTFYKSTVNLSFGDVCSVVYETRGSLVRRTLIVFND